MPLEKKTLSFALLKGMDEKSSDSSRPPDALKKALNVVFDKKGQVSKRGGFVLTDSRTDKEADGESGDISVGKAISKFQDETLILDGSNLYTKIVGSGVYNKGTYVPSTVNNELKHKQIDRRQGNAQVAENNGIRVYVWEEYKFANRYEFGTEYEIYADVEHIETGATLVNRHLIASNVLPSTPTQALILIAFTISANRSAPNWVTEYTSCLNGWTGLAIIRCTTLLLIARAPKMRWRLEPKTYSTITAEQK